MTVSQSAAASALLTRAELDGFNDFIAPLRAEPALTRTIDLGVREITNRVKLINRDKAAVILALQNINSTD
jgi:lysyl aminopeptidase / alanine aminopeptidase